MFKTNLARENWKNKYQYKGETPLETQKRAAKAIASVEKNPEEWEDKFLNVLVKFDKNGNPVGLKNTLGGRITANIGTDFHGATLLNCFVNGEVKNAKISYDRVCPDTDLTIRVEYETESKGDNLRNIMLTLLEQAETLKSEGGYGINFGFIRPRGSIIKSIGIRHPGVIHYMTIWDTVANVRL
jgi:ribonucleoside-diphosphate reductase alpha chain